MISTDNRTRSASERSIFLVTDSDRRSFVRDETFHGQVCEHPVIIDCADLPGAQKYSRQLRDRYSDDLTLLPILRVHALAPTTGTAPAGVVVPGLPKSVVSLAIDLELLGIAHGIEVVSPDVASTPAFADQVDVLLRAAGYRRRSEVPGWSLTVENPTDRNTSPNSSEREG